MNKRLLFVDDEPMLLNGLRRALHPMRQDWDMTFVDSAHDALAEVDSRAYDAIITDMQMPTMDGAQLLDEVKARQPDVVRFILSGQTSRQSLLRSIDPTHQLLSKPCDIEELKARLGLAFAMRDLLTNPSLRTVIARLRSIPSLPVIYQELTSVLALDTASIELVEEIIRKDVAMAAKILQLANSAFIGASGQVSSLLRAISLIGTDTIRTLVLSMHVFSQLEKNDSAAVYFPALWDHSVQVAGLAKRIAGLEKQSRAFAEMSFTAGLLHDVGRVVLLAELTDEYRSIFDGYAGESETILDRESERFGCTHAQVGAYLTSIWGLPEALVHAIALHHCPSVDPQSGFSPLTAVHCADAFAAQENPSEMNCDIQLDQDYIQRLGLSERLPFWQSPSQGVQ